METSLAEEISGRTFVSVSAMGVDLVDGVPLTLAFEGARLAAYAGCNRIFGPISWAGNVLTTEGLASTMMACPDPIGAQERILLELLGGRPSMILDGERLTLRGAGGSDTGSTAGGSGGITIEFIERHAPTLVGTRWGLVGIVKDEGVHSLPEGVGASIEITESRIAVDFGCNTGGGEVTVAGGTLEFGFLRMTRKMCEPGAMEVESHLALLLQGTVAYSIEGERLTLTRDQIGARFESR